ncbi:MAG: hypothetical protein ACI853_000404 [Paracoccaceae bacterium]|jgi:hypothetical protein
MKKTGHANHFDGAEILTDTPVTTCCQRRIVMQTAMLQISARFEVITPPPHRLRQLWGCRLSWHLPAAARRPLSCLLLPRDAAQQRTTIR